MGVNWGTWPQGRMGFVRIGVGRQNFCPRCHRIAMLIHELREGCNSLTSIMLQEHNSRIDNRRGGIGRRWLANWCKGLGISPNTR